MHGMKRYHTMKRKILKNPIAFLLALSMLATAMSCISVSTHAYGEVKTSALGLIVHRIPAKYTYENMVSDINTLTKTYGQQIRCTALCSTADGRTVYDLTVGNLDSGNEIIMIGAIVVMFLFITRTAGGGRMASFGKSKARMNEGGKKVTFNSFLLR